MDTLKIYKPWVHLNPRNDINDIFIQYNLPQMDIYTCSVRSNLVYDTSVKICVLGNICNDDPPVVVIQIAEQYNGLYQSFTLEQFKNMCSDTVGWGELLQVVEAKLKELKL